MRKIIIFLLFSFSSFGQKGVLFDADSITLPYHGTYKIYVKQNQPYLKNYLGEQYKIVTENMNEVFFQNQTTFSVGDAIQKTFLINGKEYISCNKVLMRDSSSVSLTMPDTNYVETRCTILFFGVYNDKFQTWDNTATLKALGGLFYYVGDDGIEHSEMYLKHNHTETFFRIQNFSHIELVYLKRKNKWYLSTSNFNKIL